MDGLTFISNLVRDLAWPVAISLLVIIFLNKLPTLGGIVKSVRYKDIEVALRDNFATARDAASSLKTVGDLDVKFDEARTDKVMQLAKIDPAVAAIEIWRKLEDETVKLIQHNGLMRYTNPVQFVEHLWKLGKLSNDEFRLFTKLREIRNASVHSHNPAPLTLAELVEYNDLVDALVRRFQQLRSEPGYIDIPETQG